MKKIRNDASIPQSSTAAVSQPLDVGREEPGRIAAAHTHAMPTTNHNAAALSGRLQLTRSHGNDVMAPATWAAPAPRVSGATLDEALEAQ